MPGATHGGGGITKALICRNEKNRLVPHEVEWGSQTPVASCRNQADLRVVGSEDRRKEGRYEEGGNLAFDYHTKRETGRRQNLLRDVNVLLLEKRREKTPSARRLGVGEKNEVDMSGRSLISYEKRSAWNNNLPSS